MNNNELEKRAKARAVAGRELRRAGRLSAGLTAAIRQGHPARIRYWQVIGLAHYEIPFGDWLASQTIKHGILPNLNYEIVIREEKARKMNVRAGIKPNAINE